MWRERFLHIRSARLEDVEQISMTTFEIIEYVCQLPFGGILIEAKNSVDDMIGTDLIGGVEIAGFSRGLEGPDDDPGRIRTQIQVLAIQESGLRQSGSPGSRVMRSLRHATI